MRIVAWAYFNPQGTISQEMMFINFRNDKLNKTAGRSTNKLSWLILTVKTHWLCDTSPFDNSVVTGMD